LASEDGKDDVYVRNLQDVSSLDCIRCEDLKILYHRAPLQVLSNTTGMIDSIINTFFAVKYFDDSLIIFRKTADSDIHEDLTVRKQAFLMTQLLQKYLDYLPAHIPSTYPVTKLQDRLNIHYD
jgi:hypothetical protein